MLLPAFTGFGLAALVITRKAVPAVDTAIFEVAVLLARFVSRDAVATVTVSAMFVPEAVPAVTL
jgi:hypothetical protein